MQEIVTKFLEGDHEIYMKRIGTNTILQRLFHMEIKKQLKEKDMKYYYYLITFTLHPTVRKDEWEEVEKYILEQVKRPALKIVEAHYTKEFTKVGIPHWHVSVKATRYIAKNRFNYYVKRFGNIDISKSTNKSLTESINYINKDSISKQLI